MVRLTLLEALYTKRRVDPGTPALYSTELESLLGHASTWSSIWYLVQRKYVSRDDQSRLMITAEGVDYLEQNYKGLQRKRLQVRPSDDATAQAFFRICSSRPPSANCTSSINPLIRKMPGRWFQEIGRVERLGRAGIGRLPDRGR